VAATRAEPALKADRTPDAESTPKAATPKADAASTAGPRDETAETARTAAKPKDDDSAGEPAASGAKPAAAATSAAKSASATAEPAKSAETAKPAEQDDKPPTARDGETGQQRQVTVVPGVPRYHTDNCILIRFMDDDDMQQMSLTAATDAGCTPCGACQPGD
jgi:hypothetical protein